MFSSPSQKRGGSRRAGRQPSRPRRRDAALLTCGALLLCSALAAGVQDDAGKREYVRGGCDSCHGPDGHGAGQAPELAGLKREYPDFVSIVREGVGEMPPHSKDEVSDDQLDAIYKWLRQLPPKSAARAIPRAPATSLRRARTG